MDKLKKYLYDVFGMETQTLPIKSGDKNRLPVYMRKYDLGTIVINNNKIITVKAEDYTEFTTEKFRKQADLIKKIFDLPVVFILENLEAYKRKRLIEKKVAFVVPGKQIYIPELLIELREVKELHLKKKKGFSPAVQCLLLYYLLGNEVTGLNFKTLAQKLNYGQMTITRAAYKLNEYNFCIIKGGKNKTLVFEKEKTQIWNEALSFLTNPTEKEIYLDDIVINNRFYITNLNALAKYTNIAEENKNAFAVYKDIFRKLHKNGKWNTANAREGKYLIQIWNYDPGKLTKNRYVDPLSLYLCLNDIEDERVKKELKNLIGKIWLKD